jgi:hypothetical protein
LTEWPGDGVRGWPRMLGYKPKEALVTYMCELLRILNAIARSGRPFNPSHA